MRPITLARNKVDVIVGNPPWINYNQTTDVLRDELVNQSGMYMGFGLEAGMRRIRMWRRCSTRGASIYICGMAD